MQNLVIFLFCALSFSTSTDRFSVSYSNGSYSHTDEIDDDYQVIAQYDSITEDINLEKIGIKATSDSFSEDACRAIGFAEGYLLASEIKASMRNRVAAFHTQLTEAGLTNDSFLNFTTNNLNWIKTQIQQYPTSNYWKLANVVYLQILGLIDGYNNRLGESLTEEDVWYLQAIGERHDLFPFLATNATYYTSQDIPNNWMTAAASTTMVRLRTSGVKELYIGHSAYDSYSALQRMSKRISYITPEGTRNWVALSTAPGCIGSTDEFYLTGNKLGVASTKIASFNSSVYTAGPITHEGVMGWMRSLIASIYATTASDWINYSTQYSSFTDTKVTTIVDYNKYDRDADSDSEMAPTGTVTILETYPAANTETTTTNYYVRTDVSSQLTEDKYVLVQNAPFSEEVYNTLGFEEAVGTNNTNIFYLGRENSSRIQNMADNYKVNSSDLLSMEKMIRYNAYKTDDYAVVPGLDDVRDPCAQFGAHCELRDNTTGLKPLAYGTVGTSIASYYSLKYRNFALSVGAAPIYKEDDMTVSDMASYVDFDHTDMDSDMMGRSYDMIAAIYERQYGIRLVMLIILIIACTIALVAIIAAIIYCVRSILKKKAAQKQAYGYYDQSPMN